MAPFGAYGNGKEPLLCPYCARDLCRSDLCLLQHIRESSGGELNAGPLEIRSIFSNPGPESNWYRLRID